jgi:hypothetical protein
MPISLAELSITHQLRALSAVVANNVPDEPAGGALGLAILAMLWLSLSFWRVRRLEA